MVGQLKISPQEYFLPRWEDEKWRHPFLFSATIHLAILVIALLPSSLFHFSRATPEFYSVNLIDLDERPIPAPEKVQETSKEETKEETVAPAEQASSLQPILSTRTIPDAPTEIKLLRPRAIKKDLRLPPMDPTLVLAALNRIQQQEKAVEKKEEALEAIRKSILARETTATEGSKNTDTGSQQKISSAQNSASPGYAGPPGSGQAANTAIKQYSALINQHIGKFWSLPEGQVWNKNLQATVLVKVRADGIVTSSSLEKTSANAQFDKFVLQTIELASPLPPAPIEIANIPLRLNFYPGGMN